MAITLQRPAALKKQLNIDPHYFIATVEDPTPEQLAQVLAEIKALLARAADNA